MFYSKPQARTFSAQFSATPFSPPTGLLVKMEFYQSHKKDADAFSPYLCLFKLNSHSRK